MLLLRKKKTVLFLSEKILRLFDTMVKLNGHAMRTCFLTSMRVLRRMKYFFCEVFAFARRVIIQSIITVLFLISCRSVKDDTCLCTDTYNPVCAGNTQFRNSCLAACEGYPPKEIRILLSQDEIDTGMLVSVDCSL